jgi:hypothetical protein
MPRLSPILVRLLIALLPVANVQADDPPADIPALIEQLDDADFSRREAAGQALRKRGRPAIDPLAKAAAGTSPEVTSRAVGLLERMMESDDPPTVDAADAALVTLLDSQDPQASTLAQAALDRKAVIRERRAIEKIKELGGQVQMGPQVYQNGQPLPGLTFEQAREPRPRKFLIGKDWKGGVDGLDQFRKLTHISFLAIYVEDGSGVPLERVQSLASVLPGLEVHHRGPFLGVVATSDGECVIRQVQPDSPAHKAGLQAGDHVLAIEDAPVRIFQNLVDALMDYDVGDTVTLKIQRHAQALEVDVKLESWALPPVADDATFP